MKVRRPCCVRRLAEQDANPVLSILERASEYLYQPADIRDFRTAKQYRAFVAIGCEKDTQNQVVGILVMDENLILDICTDPAMQGKDVESHLLQEAGKMTGHCVKFLDMYVKEHDLKTQRLLKRNGFRWIKSMPQHEAFHSHPENEEEDKEKLAYLMSNRPEVPKADQLIQAANRISTFYSPHDPY